MLDRTFKNETYRVNLLTDFDEVMIKEQSMYLQLEAYFSFLSLKEKWNFTKNLVNAYKNYKKSGEASFVYSLFAECPVESLDRVVSRFTDNTRWKDFLNKLNVKRIGIVSRNNHRIISKYLDFAREFLKGFDLQIVAANKLEIEEEHYTGKLEFVVNNNDLKDLVCANTYICGRDEKKILKSSGMQPSLSEHGLFVFDNV
jgi:hypothetical protein